VVICGPGLARVGSGPCAAYLWGWPVPMVVGAVVAGMIGFAEQAGERVNRFEEQHVDAGLLAGGAAGAEFGDGAAMRCARSLRV
jgi:hypothetical protein